MKELVSKTITIVSRFYTSVPVLDLADFLNHKCKKMTLILHPFPFNLERGSTLHYRTHGTEEIKKEVKYRSETPDLWLYVKSFFVTIKWLLQEEKQDIFIGLGNWDALSGIILRKLGKVDKVIFYTIDYIPNRFPQKWLNIIYHRIDSYVVKSCDIIWNLSAEMITQRQHKGISEKYRAKQITVPIGTYPREQEAIPKENTVAFIGHLRPLQGLEMLVSAWREVVSRIPSAGLLVIGGGPLLSSLKEQSARLGITKNIEFLGFIEDSRQAEDMLSKCALAVAPYNPSEAAFIRYADPGKIKTYLTAGLPILLTSVPPIAKEIEHRKAGVIVEFDARSIAETIISLLEAPEQLSHLRKNAKNMAEDYRWKNIYTKAFSYMENSK